MHDHLTDAYQAFLPHLARSAFEVWVNANPDTASYDTIVNALSVPIALETSDKAPLQAVSAAVLERLRHARLQYRRTLGDPYLLYQLSMVTSARHLRAVLVHERFQTAALVAAVRDILAHVQSQPDLLRAIETVRDDLQLKHALCWNVARACVFN
jgi:hypothetical protein